MKISKNYTLEDLCHSAKAIAENIDNMPSEEEITNLIGLAVNIIEPLRSCYGDQLIINSCFRNEEVNRLVGGKANSQHKKGQAVDLRVLNGNNRNNAVLFNFIKANLKFDQLIWEKGTEKNPEWVHISFSLIKNRKQVIHL